MASHSLVKRNSASATATDRLRRLEQVEQQSPLRARYLDRLMAEFLNDSPAAPIAAPTAAVSADQLNKLSYYANILADRGRGIELAVDRPIDADALDDVADQSLEIIEAAQAIETICGRAARWARKEHP